MIKRKYPYIGEINPAKAVTLFTSYEYGFGLSNTFEEFQGCYSGDWNEYGFDNITEKYLSETYGKVLSEEHAEFIRELAKGHGFDIEDEYCDSDEYFYFYNGSLLFSESYLNGFDTNMERIALPLPPEGWKPEQDTDSIGNNIKQEETNMETTTIYVAVDKEQQFEDTGHCTIAYVGTEQQIIYNILEDDGDLIDYVFYELDQSNKYEIKQSLVKV